jgi:hypothetical protein
MDPSKEKKIIIKSDPFPQMSLEGLLQEFIILGSDLWFRTRSKNTNSLRTRALKLLPLLARQKVLQTDLHWYVRTRSFPPEFCIQFLLTFQNSMSYTEPYTFGSDIFFLQSVCQVVIMKPAGWFTGASGIRNSISTSSSSKILCAFLWIICSQCLFLNFPL